MSKYRFCGNSQIGKSHEESGMVCQDSCCCLEHDSFVIAAVADGLGSCKHSDVASNMAVNGSVLHCAENIASDMNEEQILEVIKKAFDVVNFDIKRKAGDFPDEYDTTLTLAIFNEGNIYFGHAGDSGIIALRTDGLFEEITTPQLGEGQGNERSVHPLATESRWVFEKYKHKVKSVFLMTDGMLNKVVPPLLKNQNFMLDHAYLYYIYDNLCKNPNLDDWVTDELLHMLPQEVNHDDKTLVCAMCETVKINLQAQEYYEYPSKELWDTLMENYKKVLYEYKIDSGLQPSKQQPKRQSTNKKKRKKKKL
jgi:hypothetical protein